MSLKCHGNGCRAKEACAACCWEPLPAHLRVNVSLHFPLASVLISCLPQHFLQDNRLWETAGSGGCESSAIHQLPGVVIHSQLPAHLQVKASLQFLLALVLLRRVCLSRRMLRMCRLQQTRSARVHDMQRPQKHVKSERKNAALVISTRWKTCAD